MSSSEDLSKGCLKRSEQCFEGRAEYLSFPFFLWTVSDIVEPHC